jgi:hypothetical protein
MDEDTEPWATLSVDDAEVIVTALRLLGSRIDGERAALTKNALTSWHAHWHVGKLVQLRAENIAEQFQRSIDAVRKGGG